MGSGRGGHNGGRNSGDGSGFMQVPQSVEHGLAERSVRSGRPTGLGILNRGGMKPSQQIQQREVTRHHSTQSDFRTKDGPLTRARQSALDYVAWIASVGSGETTAEQQVGWKVVGKRGAHAVTRVQTRSMSGPNRRGGGAVGGPFAGGRGGGGAVAGVTTRSMSSTSRDGGLASLQQRVKQHGKIAIDCGDNGNCFYQACVHQIRTVLPNLLQGGATVTWERLRWIAADWLATHESIEGEDGSICLSEHLLISEDGWDGHNWEKFVANVRDCRSENPVWAGHVIVTAMANALNTPLWIWTSRVGEEVECVIVNPVGFDRAHPGKAIELGHVVENHYLSVVKRQTDTSGEDVFWPKFKDGLWAPSETRKTSSQGDIVIGSEGGNVGGSGVPFTDGGKQALEDFSAAGTKRSRNSPVPTSQKGSGTKPPAKRDKPDQAKQRGGGGGERAAVGAGELDFWAKISKN